MLKKQDLLYYSQYINFPYLIQDLGLDIRRGLQPSAKEIQALCPNPMHNDTNPSFFVSKKTGQFYCWGCGFKGGILTLVKFIKNINTSEALSFIEQYFEGDIEGDIENIIPLKKRELKYEEDPKIGIKQIFLPKEYTRYASEALWYLHYKGIDPNIVRANFDIGYCYSGYYIGRMVIPVEFNHTLVMVQARSISNEVQPKDLFTYNIKKQYIYNYDKLKRNEFLIVTESPLDVYRIFPYYPNVTCIFGSAVLKEQAESLLNISKDIGLMPDPDSGFTNMMKSAMQYLYHKTNLSVSTINKKDIALSINSFMPIGQFLSTNWRFIKGDGFTKSLYR